MSIRIKVAVNGSLTDDIRRELEARMLALHGRLVQKSPVDTGQFRSAWTVDTATLSIENHTVYAEPLAGGHSPQASDGWIESEIDTEFRL